MISRNMYMMLQYWTPQLRIESAVLFVDLFVWFGVFFYQKGNTIIEPFFCKKGQVSVNDQSRNVWICHISSKQPRSASSDCDIFSKMTLQMFLRDIGTQVQTLPVTHIFLNDYYFNDFLCKSRIEFFFLKFNE